MAEIGGTQLDVLRPEVWRSRLLKGLYSKPVASQRVVNVAGDVSGPGDIL